MTQINELQALFGIEIDLSFPMAVGAGSVDPRLIAPGDAELDIEELIAFRTSCL